jgi:hypothetical protein
VILGRYETDSVPDGVGTTRPADAVNIVLRMHREVIIHHVRDAVDIDPAGGDVSRNQHAHGAGLEVL